MLSDSVWYIGEFLVRKHITEMRMKILGKKNNQIMIDIQRKDHELVINYRKGP